MFTYKFVGLYREACIHSLPVSLSLSHHNGRESFSFTTIPGPDLAGWPERRRRPRGGRRRRGRENHGACADQPANAAPFYAAVVRSPPSPLVSLTAKHPRGLHATAEFARPARSTMDANTTVATDIIPTADAPLPTTAAIDVFPIASAAAVSHAEEPATANILQRDSDATAATLPPSSWN